MLDSLHRFSPSGQAAGAAPSSAFQFDPGVTCKLTFSATTELGPNAGQAMQGTLSLTIGSDGAIDTGTLQLADGTFLPVVGQATGRSIRLRASSDPSAVFTFTGSGEHPPDQCTGKLSGAFSGPDVQNLGVWSAAESQGA